MQDEKALYNARIEQLRQALRKCSPFRIDAYMEVEGYCYSCSVGFGFADKHKDDCEYVKLCGGEETE